MKIQKLKCRSLYMAQACRSHYITMYSLGKARNLRQENSLEIKNLSHYSTQDVNVVLSTFVANKVSVSWGYVQVGPITYRSPSTIALNEIKCLND